MTQYLLAVHSVEGEPMPSQEQIQRAYKDVDALNGELQSSGVWVFAGGLQPPTAATVVRARAARSSPPTARSPRRRSSSAASGSSTSPTWTRRWSGPARRPSRAPPPSRSGRSRRSRRLEPCRPWTPRPSSAPTGRVRAGRGHPGPPLWRYRPRRRGGPGGLRRRRRSGGRRRVCRPTRAAGSSPPRGTGPWTGCAGSRPGTAGRPRPPCCGSSRSPGDLAELAEVEPVPDDRLRLIFTCCHPALGRRERSSRSPCGCGRAADPGDRACLSHPGGDRSRSGWSGPSGRSATRRSRTVFPATPS